MGACPSMRAGRTRGITSGHGTPHRRRGHRAAPCAELSRRAGRCRGDHSPTQRLRHRPGRASDARSGSRASARGAARHGLGMSDDALVWMTAAEAAALIRGRRLSPTELVRAYLERIERLDATLRAYITVCGDAALAAARAAEAQ